jgi:methylated-DNA-[protein]-cysteine S-methyltransferase
MTSTTATSITGVCRVVDSPIGPLTIAGTGDGTVTNLCMADQAHAPARRDAWAREEGAFDDVAAQLQEYFARKRRTFDFAMRLEGTPFQRDVWHALLTVPYGETATYGEIASAIGNPSACRAVGLANGRNPIAIAVPCHRIIGKSGSLTGYGGGLTRKEQLLALEGALSTQ